MDPAGRDQPGSSGADARGSGRCDAAAAFGADFTASAAASPRPHGTTDALAACVGPTRVGRRVRVSLGGGRHERHRRQRRRWRVRRRRLARLVREPRPQRLHLVPEAAARARIGRRRHPLRLKRLPIQRARARAHMASPGQRRGALPLGAAAHRPGGAPVRRRRVDHQCGEPCGPAAAAVADRRLPQPRRRHRQPSDGQGYREREPLPCLRGLPLDRQHPRRAQRLLEAARAPRAPHPPRLWLRVPAAAAREPLARAALVADARRPPLRALPA